MEDYEKKYKEALKRAKSAIKECGDNKGRITMIESIFPELAETEDEMIREAILSTIKSQGFISDEETLQQCVAWLEKQNHDGKKWIYEDDYIKEKEQVFQDGIDEVLENPQRYGLEKQGEQKPAWSEEDEKMYKSALWHISNSTTNGKSQESETEVTNWLLHIKERLSEHRVKKCTTCTNDKGCVACENGELYKGKPIDYAKSNEEKAKVKFSDIVFVRADFFIDKACEWLKDNIHDYYVTNEFEQWFDDMFEDFRKAMEE